MKEKNSLHAKVVVVTRTKDRPLLLERAIKSVHGQSFSDYVHVVINDAGAAEPVDKLIEKHKELIQGRVHVIHNKVSRGMEAASNKAIKSVTSDYVAIHDDDDTWHPDFLKETTAYLVQAGAHGVVVTTDKVEEKIEGDTVEFLRQDRWLPHVRTISLYNQCLDNYATPITFLYSRAAYEEIGGYDELLPVAGDWEFTLRFLLKYDINFLVTEDALAFYHHRPQASGINQNSVFLNNGLLHEQKITAIANKYLREELQRGRLGIGYIISSLRHQNEGGLKLQQHYDKIVQESVVRLEGHVNYAIEQQNVRIDQQFNELSRRAFGHYVNRINKLLRIKK